MMQRTKGTRDNIDRFDELALKLGILGPGSLAHYTQSRYHLADPCRAVPRLARECLPVPGNSSIKPGPTITGALDLCVYLAF